ncbi:hypothetical protein CF327_g604 [Tilletia walkeri]|nr:hypothetical protein CF327_g604 [Tilletia walkeri]
MYHPQHADGGPGRSNGSQYPQAGPTPSSTQTSFHRAPVQHQHLMTHTYPSPDGPLSPLDALVRSGKQARRDAHNGNGRGVLSQDLLTRAHSLSRSTSVRTAHPTNVSEEHDFQESGRAGGPSSYRSRRMDNLGVAGTTALVRKDSVDTVRSSEFGEEGRWAKAWTRRPDDEESLFDDGSSQWDAESYRSSDDIGWTGQEPISEEEEYSQAQAALKNSAVLVDRSAGTNDRNSMLRHDLYGPSSRPLPIPQSSGPLGPATLLNQAIVSQNVGLSQHTEAYSISSDASSVRSPRGHPAGRLPPPPPPAGEGVASSSRPISGAYQDPNQPYGQPIASERDWTASLGKHRAAVLAAHDGRASLVSDLDVETLRLDDSSSRRSSTSTIALTTQTPSGLAPTGPTQRRSGESWRGRFSGEIQRTNAANVIANYEQHERVLREHERSGHPAPIVGEGYTPNGSGPPMQRSTIQAAAEAHRAEPTATHSRLAESRSQATISSSNSFAHTTDHSQSLHSGPANGNGIPRPQHQQNVRQQPSVVSLSKPAPKPISTAEELLSRGIEYHEAGDLSRSVFYFERSAKVEGGCVVGMCMYGMALREGWGAKKDQRRGFEWIQAAATRAGEVLKVNQPRTEAEINALKSELKLSVYELGKCYCYGWGIKMDKHMALEYFELAAKLGDADAQAEAGALYATGKGCKKDLKKAARYYRMAEAQGYDTVGLSWIHKEKYL